MKFGDYKGKTTVITGPQELVGFVALDAPRKYKNPQTGEEGASRYSTNFVMDGKDPACQELLAKIQEIEEATLEKVLEEFASKPKKNAGGKKPKPPELTNHPYYEEVDEDGEETGRIVFKLGKKAEFKDKENGNKIVKLFLPIVDSKRNPIKGVRIGQGSVASLNFMIDPYFTPLSVGVSLKLSAVQLIKLVKPISGAASMFDEVEDDGYVFDESDSSTGFGSSVASSDDDEDGEGDGDF